MSQTVSIRLGKEVVPNTEQHIEHEAWQIKAIEQTLSKVQSGKAKFASHEAVSDWLNSWGSETEVTVPRCEEDGNTPLIV